MAAATSKYLEKRIELLTRELMRAEEEKAKAEVMAERFGKDEDYADQTVIAWDFRFNNQGIKYSFVAVKVAGRWYTTSQYDKIMSFDDLVDKYLSKAIGVWVVTAWDKI